MERTFLKIGNAATADETVLLWQSGRTNPSPPVALPLRDVASRLGTHKAIVAVASETVALLPVTLPVRGRRQRLQALPYVLEEQLLEDVETLAFHLAEGTEDDGRLTAAVANREHLARWHTLLKECGIAVEALVPDALLLPWRPGSWTLAQDGPERVLVRHGHALGGAFHPDLLPLYLERLGGEARERGRFPESVASYGVPRLKEIPDNLWEPHSGDWLAEADTNPPRLDLLAGFAAQRSRAGEQWRTWRTSVVLAAAWLLVLWIHLGLDVLHYGHERSVLERRIVALFHRTFPEDRHIVDVRIQMARGLSRLERRAAAGDWARLLADAAAARPSQLRFDTADYRNGRLVLTVEDSSAQDLVRFLHTLDRRSGIRAKTAGLTTAGGVTHARVILQSPGG